MWPTQGEGRSCKYNLHFINEADETFIGGGTGGYPVCFNVRPRTNGRHKYL